MTAVQVQGCSTTLSLASGSGARFLAFVSMDDDFAADISRSPCGEYQLLVLPCLLYVLGCSLVSYCYKSNLVSSWFKALAPAEDGRPRALKSCECWGL